MFYERSMYIVSNLVDEMESGIILFRRGAFEARAFPPKMGVFVSLLLKYVTGLSCACQWY